METAKIVIRLKPSRKTTPRKAPQLHQKIASLLPRSTLRITNGLIEIVAFVKPSRSQLAVVEKILEARLVELKEVKEDELPMNGQCLAEAYASLLEENRFWEAHVLGEAIWRTRGVIGRYLAVLAGAYAKAQEGLINAAEKILEKALSPEELRRLADEHCLRRELVRAYEEGEARVTDCIDTRRLAAIICRDASVPERGKPNQSREVLRC